jgi:hypothetical protein
LINTPIAGAAGKQGPRFFFDNVELKGVHKMAINTPHAEASGKRGRCFHLESVKKDSAAKVIAFASPT